MCGSIMDVCIGWAVDGGEWNGRQKLEYKTVVGYEQSPKTSLEGLCCLLNGWNEAQSTLWMFGLFKQAATQLGYCQPRYLPVPKNAIQVFQIIVNSPQLESVLRR